MRISTSIAIPVWVGLAVSGYFWAREEPQALEPVELKPELAVEKQAPVVPEEDLTPADPGGEMLEERVKVWARRDVEGATRFAVANLPEDEVAAFLKETIVEPFALLAPEIVLRSAFATGDEALAKGMIYALTWQVSNGALPGALEFLNTSDNETVRTYATSEMVRTWATLDFAAAAGWVRAQEPSGWRDEVVGSLARSVGSMGEDAANVYEFVASLPPREQIIATEEIGSEMARESPRLYFDLMENFAAGGLVEANLTTVAKNIGVYDPRLAVSLAERVPPGEKRRTFLGEIASAWSQTEPELAAEWASSLEDPADRIAATNSLRLP